MALEPGSKRGLGRDPSGLDIDTNQPRGLRPAESGHVLDVGPKKPLGAPLLKRVLVMAEQTLHPAVNLRAPATGEPHTLRGGKKCLDLNQTQLLGSKHADHPSSACPFQPLQAHLALESTPPLRLILRWTRVPGAQTAHEGIHFPGATSHHDPGSVKTRRALCGGSWRGV